MTDTTLTLPITADFVRVPAKELKQTAGWLCAAGLGFGALLQAYSRALGTVYSAPFQAASHGRKHGMDEDLEGRDPNW
jgi:hypothetical protein